MATVGIPALGYGIRYDFGLFRQTIVDGWQRETPEDWLSFRNPWEFERRESNYQIGFGGTVAVSEGWDGTPRHKWVPGETVIAVAYDTPILGWRGEKVNTLRLWRARAIDPIHLEAFNRGDHVGALAERTRAESISRVLYPSDATPAGQELRLRQEFFFTSASLQDLVRRHVAQFGDIRTLPDKAAIQLNDTHPALAVVELMRLLVDVHNLGWEDAWAITQSTIAYTNHTLLARGARELARDVDGAHAAAPHADHLRAQRQASRRGARKRACRGHRARGHVADRRAQRPQCPHGLSRLRRRPQGQRRVGAAHRSDEARRCSTTSTACSRTASSTRPTASRRGAGCSWPIPP